jgi:chromate transporter
MPPSGETALQDQPAVEPRGRLLDLFWTFLKCGTTSFGGASRAIMYSESVERHSWLDEKDFLAGFAVSQVLPGANPVNLALYIGLKVRGAVGAAVAVLGMVIPAFCVIMTLGFLYRQFGNLPATHFVLEGVAAAGVGATIAVGIKVTARLPRDLMTIAIALAIFATVGVLHWPLVPVVAVAVPFSIGAAYVMRERRNRVS